MSRKTIFQLVEENYDIQTEIKKVNKLFVREYYFCLGLTNYTFEELMNDYLFSDWKYSDTCIDTNEYLTRVNAKISHSGTASEEQIINNLEVMENFIKLYFDKSKELLNKYGVEYYETFTSVFCKLINTLEKRMGLTTREYKDRVVIYPKNAPLELVIDLCEDEDVQWELIQYVREDLSLTEKRKSLAYLATNLYIEKDSSEEDENIKMLIKKAGNILNNLHIRHNNKTGKWENKALNDLDESDAISLCDMVFNEMLTIVLLREHKEYDKINTEFNKKQRQSKAKKTPKEKSNG